MHRLTRLAVATALAAVPVLAVAGGAAAQSSPPPFPPFPTPPTFPTFPTFPAPTPIPPISFPTPTPFPTFPFPGTPAPPVTATLAGGTLSVTGGSGDDLVSISPSDIVSDGVSTVRGGTTSVDLDLPLLEQAAGLTLTGADTPGRPTGSGFLVGFPILPSTDFRYVASPFSPVSGTIRHTGTVTFNGAITVGDFDIGFDPARATGGRSGFFVASTTGVEAVLFDLAPPSSVAAAVNRLNVGRTELLVSPEFAGFLGDPALAGADVGAARIDALAVISAGRRLVVTTANGLLAPFRTTSFPADQVDNVVIDTGSGRNRVSLDRLDLVGELRITGGSGDDNIRVNETATGTLVLDARGGRDFVTVSALVAVTTSVDLGDGNDLGSFQNSLFTGDRAIRGGGGSDIGSTFRTDLTADAITGFEGFSQS